MLPSLPQSQALPYRQISSAFIVSTLTLPPPPTLTPSSHQSSPSLSLEEQPPPPSSPTHAEGCIDIFPVGRSLTSEQREPGDRQAIYQSRGVPRRPKVDCARPPARAHEGEGLSAPADPHDCRRCCGFPPGHSGNDRSIALILIIDTSFIIICVEVYLFYYSDS